LSAQYNTIRTTYDAANSAAIGTAIFCADFNADEPH
jgi:hypothetical protein